MFLQVNLFSLSLQMGTNVNIIIPSPDSDEILTLKPTENKYFGGGKKYQVLYLLHGGYGDYSDWQRFTSIEKYAQQHQVAVVMPSVGNSLYRNMHHGLAYATYLTEELPNYISNYFNISAKRENTFVAGLSMGGYGAYYLALRCPQRYSAAASLSGALDIAATYEKLGNEATPLKWADIFADPQCLTGSDADLFALAQKNLAEGNPMPKLFQTVGTEDFIYDVNQKARAHFEAMPLDYTYTEHPGIHDWNFWDTYIQEVLDWLPLAGGAVQE